MNCLSLVEFLRSIGGELGAEVSEMSTYVLALLRRSSKTRVYICGLILRITSRVPASRAAAPEEDCVLCIVSYFPILSESDSVLSWLLTS